MWTMDKRGARWRQCFKRPHQLIDIWGNTIYVANGKWSAEMTLETENESSLARAFVEGDNLALFALADALQERGNDSLSNFLQTIKELPC